MVGQPIVPVCDCLTGQFESVPSSAADIDDPMVCQVHGHLGWNGEGRRLFYDTGGNCIVSYGLPEGYDKLVVADIIVLLIEALKGIGATDNRLISPPTTSSYRVTLKPTTTIPAAPRDQAPPHSAVSDFPIG